MAEDQEGLVEQETPDVIEDNKDANAIASMLWVWKWVNRERLKYENYSDNLYIRLAPGDIKDEKFVGGFLETSGDTLTNVIKTYRFYYVVPFFGNKEVIDFNPDVASKYKDIYESYSKDEAKEKKEARLKELTKILESGDLAEVAENTQGTGRPPSTFPVEVRVEPVISQKISTESPIKGFDKEDACWINTEPTQYYLRFGALLDYIADNIIPKIDTAEPDYFKKPPLFRINRDKYSNFMYSLPNQISLDPRVCIVRNDVFMKTGGKASVFSALKPFRSDDFSSQPNPNKAYPMNIYLNFAFIIECLNSNTDNRGDISIYNFLKTLCDGLNKALGGINNLEPVMDEEVNTLRIIDTTPIPGVSTGEPKYVLQLYGYDKLTNGYRGTFVRKVDLKTAITPEYATMITVGATAGGYVKGTDATAFSKWNAGLTDRFKENLLPGNENSSPDNGVDEAVINYTDKFLANRKFTQCYGFSGNLMAEGDANLKISTDAIESNLSVVTEYYKYLISSQKNQQGGTIGFIPFKINFTMDGISGIKIYNKLHVDTRFLPRAYEKDLDLIVTGVSHRLASNDWETDVEATVIPKTNQLKDLVITKESVMSSISEGVRASSGAGNPSGYGDQYGVCGTPERYNVSQITPNSEVDAAQAKKLLNKVIQKVIQDTNGASRSVCAAYVKRIVKKYFEYYNKPKVKLSSIESWKQSLVSVGGLHAKNKSTHDWLITSFGYKRIVLGKNLSTSEARRLINSVTYNIGDVVSYWDHSGGDKGKQKYGHIQIYEGGNSWRSDFKHGSFVYGDGAGCWDIIYLQAPNKKEPEIEN
jgi:hypothetical protein